ncbi:NUDIX domain-containing protein [Bdellovibrio bacteriovorus]|uniref:NUDIX domain-containing protein n=1 Tax=Bdellovibrio bacteriovorus TaxID=959 RepID=UPI003A8010E6
MLRSYKDDREYYASLPKKRIGVGALLFYKGDLLIVQPTYNPAWILPGGTVEAEESPSEALQRELKEELGLNIQAGSLLAIDYVSNRDVKGEYMQLLFSAKDLTEYQAQNIRLPMYEIKDFKFVAVEKALEMLTPIVSRRVHSVILAQEQGLGAIYLEEGRAFYDPLRLAIADPYSLPKT